VALPRGSAAAQWFQSLPAPNAPIHCYESDSLDFITAAYNCAKYQSNLAPYIMFVFFQLVLVFSWSAPLCTWVLCECTAIRQ